MSLPPAGAGEPCWESNAGGADGFPATVIRGRASLAALRERVAAERAAGTPPRSIARIASDLTDGIVLDVWAAVMDDLRAAAEAKRGSFEKLVLVAHGGYGRRCQAPYSDVDLMILHSPSLVSVDTSVVAVARRLLQELFDIGLEVGQSVRTVSEAIRLARSDATVYTTLIEARLLAGPSGPDEPFDRLIRDLAGIARRGPERLVARLCEARAEEASRYGESTALLEPNVKRSPGGLRDLQFIHWLGYVAHGTADAAALVAAGMLSPRDAAMLAAAADHLHGVRIDLHLAAGRPADDLTRQMQQRLAEERGIAPAPGLLPVEIFMREYFRHTREVVRVVETVKARTLRRPRRPSWVTGILGHRVEDRYLVGPTTVAVLAAHRGEVAASLAAVLRLLELSQTYGWPVDDDSWDAIRVAVGAAAAAGADADASPLPVDVCRGFLALFDRPERLGSSLRRLHDIGLLERIIPEFSHARDLLQFNNYHKYTVDEHSIRAVEAAVAHGASKGWMADLWRHVGRRHLLLLALLIHDLGKGYEEDHSEVGRRIAESIAVRLRLPGDEAGILAFLVHKHLVMAHLAFRRDSSDPALVIRFAYEVGSPEVLSMLTLLTAADVAAVGPGVWTEWKSDLLADLQARTLRVLDGEGVSASSGLLRLGLEALLEEWEPDDPVVRIGRQLPASMLRDLPPARILEELVQLARLPADGMFVATRWQADTSTVAVTVGTRESVAPGVFHRVTGALTSQRLEILAAGIHTLDDGLVIDHFTVLDPDFTGAPPPDRFADIAAAIRAGIRADRAPTFTPRLNPLAPRPDPAQRHPVRVAIDNVSSETSTIVEVFATDAPGLLYRIARTLFDAGVSVRSAKVGTYLDQVVDGFHVTDLEGGKIDDVERLERLRMTLEEALTLPRSP